jgi:rubredoxin
MNLWRCTICGYIYDPAEGDAGNGVPPGTPFEELPAGWECPRCGVGTDLFEEIRQAAG